MWKKKLFIWRLCLVCSIFSLLVSAVDYRKFVFSFFHKYNQFSCILQFIPTSSWHRSYTFKVFIVFLYKVFTYATQKVNTLNVIHSTKCNKVWSNTKYKSINPFRSSHYTISNGVVIEICMYLKNASKMQVTLIIEKRFSLMFGWMNRRKTNFVRCHINRNILSINKFFFLSYVKSPFQYSHAKMFVRIRSVKVVNF